MKPLKPTRRQKRRNVLVKFLEGRPQNPVEWARKKLRYILGTWGYASAVAKVWEEDGNLILSVDRNWAELVAGALALGREDFVPVTYISGTLKALRRKGVL